MASFTLDDIRKAADAKYGSTDIDMGNGDVLVLVNPLRLPKEKRDVLSKVQESGKEDDKDQGDTMREAIRIVAERQDMAEKFIGIAGDDLALLATVFSSYTEGAQVGEASASQD